MLVAVLHQMDEDMFRKIVSVLQKRGKAELFNTGSGDGVKFLN